MMMQLRTSVTICRKSWTSPPEKDILVVLGDWNAKVGENAFKNWKGTCGRYCNPETNTRGLKLLEFACDNDLGLPNTLGKHKVSRRWTRHGPNGVYHNQTDFIMVRRCFMTNVNTAKTRSFPGADIGSDHDLVMSFRLRLKKKKMQSPTRVKLDLKKLKDPQVADTFQAMTGCKFAPLTLLDVDDTEVDTLDNTFNKAMTGTARQTQSSQKTEGHNWHTGSMRRMKSTEEGEIRDSSRGKEVQSHLSSPFPIKATFNTARTTSPSA